MKPDRNGGGSNFNPVWLEAEKMMLGGNMFHSRDGVQRQDWRPDDSGSDAYASIAALVWNADTFGDRSCGKKELGKLQPEATRAFEKEHGVQVKVNAQSGKLEFFLSVKDKSEAPIKLCEAENSAEGLKDAERQLKEKVAEKEKELHGRFGVTFAQPGDPTAYRADPAEITAKYEIRPARINELYGLELALEHSKPTSFNGVRIEFVPDSARPEAIADQARAKEGKSVDWFDHNGLQIVRIMSKCGERPVGDSDVTEQGRRSADSIEGTLIHEFAHASESRWKGGELHRVKVASPDGGDPVSLVQGTDGHLYLREESTGSWMRVNGRLEPLDGEAKVTDKQHAFRYESDDKMRDGARLDTVSGSMYAYHAQQMGWVMSDNGNWLLKGKDNFLYSHDEDNGCWMRVNLQEQPLNAHGQASDHAHACQFANDEQMQDNAKIRPCSTYFDTPAEEYAEAMTSLRMNAESRKELLAQNPHVYNLVRAADQNEINEKYGLDEYGQPRIIRGADGKLVENIPAARAQVQQLEASKL